MPELKLYNTLEKAKVPFVPIDPEHIRIYACGPTVYDYAHIGNARMAVVFDLLADLLRDLYPKVTYVSNITDVDDKIIAASKETGQPIGEITTKYAKIYNEDMAALGVKQPDVQPRATEHIDGMIALTEKLIQRGHAYEAEDHVLFDVPSFPAYGGLSGRSRDEQIAGARVEVASYKKDPADFVLWKPSSDDEPGWASPWGANNGRGRPGWHLECSVMAEEHLGLPFDIHGGGADLKFPHHENEIAQSCCAHGQLNDLTGFAKYWVHNGFVTVEDDKMSKSVGNIRLVHELIEDYPGEVLRLTLLSVHYRQPLNWTEDRLTESKKFIGKIRKLWADIVDIKEEEAQQEEQSYYQDVVAALCDDLNTPKAFAKINSLLSSIRKDLHVGKTDKVGSEKRQLRKVMDLLGVDLDKVPAMTEMEVSEAVEIDALIVARKEARDNKDFSKADEIRATLDSMGIVIEDSATGPTKWRRRG